MAVDGARMREDRCLDLNDVPRREKIANIPQNSRAFLRITPGHGGKKIGGHRSGDQVVRCRYSPVRVSILSFIPDSMKKGTLISAPVSSFAFFVTLFAVSPRTAGSV